MKIGIAIVLLVQCALIGWSVNAIIQDSNDSGVVILNATLIALNTMFGSMNVRNLCS